MTSKFPEFGYEPSESIYQHYAWAHNGKVSLCNDADGEYEQVFGSPEELQRFIDHLMTVADEAWEAYCEASLDLSNQGDVGEDPEEDEDYKNFKDCLQKIKNLTYEKLVELMGEEWIEDYRQRFP